MPYVSNLEPKYSEAEHSHYEHPHTELPNTGHPGRERHEAALPHPLIHLDTVNSTNSYARSLLSGTTAPAHLTTIVTDHQSAGRGRLGRTWVTTAHNALTATTLLRLPSPLPHEAPAWCLHAAALAIRDALAPLLRPHGHRVTTKWPNDVLIDGQRKICGILAEDLGERDGTHYLAVGYGVNIVMDADARPAPHATALSLEGDSDAATSPLARRDALLATIVDGINSRFTALHAAQWDPSESGLHEEAQAHCVTLGQRVALPQPHQPSPDAQTAPMEYGRALALDRSGALIVEREDGTHSLITTGDVLLPHEYQP